MKTLKDLDVDNKKVIVRVDYNVPIKKGKVVDNNRIKESLQTINYLISRNSKIILLSHMGKIKTEEDKKDNSLLPVKEELEFLLGKKIKFTTCLRGEELEKEVNDLDFKEVLLIENTRFMDVPLKLESGCDEKLSKYWASLADAYVFDAFATSHRAHASTYGIAKFLPHAAGFLIEKEISELEKIKMVDKTLLLGGAKVSDKIGLIKKLLPNSSKALIGGAMCATFLTAKGINVGKTYVDEERIKESLSLLESNKIILPIDVVTENGVKNINDIRENESILDIGPKTIKLFEENIDKRQMVLVNGTMGKYEEEAFSNGTKKIFKYLEKENVKTTLCGGDSAAAAKLFNYTPNYISTGGGASLVYLEGGEMLPLKMME